MKIIDSFMFFDENMMLDLRLNILDKYVIKLIMFITKGPTDTSKSYEFTDWSKVDDFANELKNDYL